MNRTLVASLILAAGCGAADDPEASPSAYALALPAADAARVLDLVNDPASDVDLLHAQAGLDIRAARNIAAFRAGADATLPTGDDQYFADLAALDAIPYVGDTAFKKLQAWAQAHPAPAGEVVEGVAFRGWEAQAVVWGVDHADLAALDALMDARAAKGLIDHRPYATVTEMGPVAYVGEAALGKLRGDAAAFWTAMRGTPSLAGTFDGVAFDEATAEEALAIANQASAELLVQHGMTSTAAGHVVGGRPYATLGQLAAVSGVGTATLTALRGYAQGGQWPPPADCVQSFDDAVGPHLGDLLFTSESDRPFDLVSFPGAGHSAPTVDRVLGLLATPQGYTGELRSVDNFYVCFEPANGNADPNAAALVQAAVQARLSDLIYVAVHAPAGSPYQAEVHVYLLGRTQCGDLVGLHSISVET